MTREQLKQIFKSTESSWEGDNAFQGLKILSKYTERLIEGAEHDVIFSVDVNDIIDKLTEDDAKALAKLNWSIENEFGDCFSCFV